MGSGDVGGMLAVSAVSASLGGLVTGMAISGRLLDTEFVALSSHGGHHLFINRIPPRLPKEDVEKIILAQLRLQFVLQVSKCSVIPQNSLKNKGYGFITLDGSPTPSDLDEIANSLNNKLQVGCRTLGVRVCTDCHNALLGEDAASASSSSPDSSPSSEPGGCQSPAGGDQITAGDLQVVKAALEDGSKAQPPHPSPPQASLLQSAAEELAKQSDEEIATRCQKSANGERCLTLTDGIKQQQPHNRNQQQCRPSKVLGCKGSVGGPRKQPSPRNGKADAAGEELLSLAVAVPSAALDEDLVSRPLVAPAPPSPLLLLSPPAGSASQPGEPARRPAASTGAGEAPGLGVDASCSRPQPSEGFEDARAGGEAAIAAASTDDAISGASNHGTGGSTHPSNSAVCPSPATGVAVARARHGGAGAHPPQQLHAQRQQRQRQHPQQRQQQAQFRGVSSGGSASARDAQDECTAVSNSSGPAPAQLPPPPQPPVFQRHSSPATIGPPSLPPPVCQPPLASQPQALTQRQPQPTAQQCLPLPPPPPPPPAQQQPGPHPHVQPSLPSGARSAARSLPSSAMHDGTGSAGSQSRGGRGQPYPTGSQLRQPSQQQQPRQSQQQPQPAWQPVAGLGCVERGGGVESYPSASARCPSRNSTSSSAAPAPLQPLLHQPHHYPKQQPLYMQQQQQPQHHHSGTYCANARPVGAHANTVGRNSGSGVAPAGDTGMPYGGFRRLSAQSSAPELDYGSPFLGPQAAWTSNGGSRNVSDGSGGGASSGNGIGGWRESDGASGGVRGGTSAMGQVGDASSLPSSHSDHSKHQLQSRSNRQLSYPQQVHPPPQQQPQQRLFRHQSTPSGRPYIAQHMQLPPQRPLHPQQHPRAGPHSQAVRPQQHPQVQPQALGYGPRRRMYPHQQQPQQPYNGSVPRVQRYQQQDLPESCVGKQEHRLSSGDGRSSGSGAPVKMGANAALAPPAPPAVPAASSGCFTSSAGPGSASGAKQQHPVATSPGRRVPSHVPLPSSAVPPPPVHGGWLTRSSMDQGDRDGCLGRAATETMPSLTDMLPSHPPQPFGGPAMPLGLPPRQTCTEEAMAGGEAVLLMRRGSSDGSRQRDLDLGTDLELELSDSAELNPLHLEPMILQLLENEDDDDLVGPALNPSSTSSSSYRQRHLHGQPGGHSQQYPHTQQPRHPQHMASAAAARHQHVNSEGFGGSNGTGTGTALSSSGVTPFAQLSTDNNNHGHQFGHQHYHHQYHLFQYHQHQQRQQQQQFMYGSLPARGPVPELASSLDLGPWALGRSKSVCGDPDYAEDDASLATAAAAVSAVPAVGAPHSTSGVTAASAAVALWAGAPAGPCAAGALAGAAASRVAASDAARGAWFGNRSCGGGSAVMDSSSCTGGSGAGQLAIAKAVPAGSELFLGGSRAVGGSGGFGCFGGVGLGGGGGGVGCGSFEPPCFLASSLPNPSLLAVMQRFDA
ncbi:hypothetical protein Agub_g4081 [Astrephomene gubernaculifera]|uniref:RRM domain-containing protein n=1 Tax=Astrephomene gubernaculifera TaxID=47775 RepID=A0AAD3DKY1_9CHLO|nr:hypothetical protein Agub_g4081 [Astrephomene gubernaculifera]